MSCELSKISKKGAAHPKESRRGALPVKKIIRGRGGGSATAAAAEEQQDDEDDPDPIVVVEHVAQTVVHSEPPYSMK